MSAAVPAPDPSDRSDAPPSRQWYAPRVAIALFVASVLALLWIVQRQEVEDKRQAVIRDILWVEQNVYFSLSRDVERLHTLGGGVAQRAPDQRQVEIAAQHLMSNSPGLVRVMWLDASGALRASTPRPPAGAFSLSATSEQAFRLALAIGKPSYAPPALSGQDWQVEVFVPQFREGAVDGMAVGVYDLKAILAGLVPWWLAEKHRVTIRDASGNVLAAKSNVTAGGVPELTYQVPLDPPGHGLLLHVDSYAVQTNLLRNVLAATIVCLGTIVLGSLWLLRRDVQRRLAAEQALRAEHAFRKAMEDSLETGMRAVDLERRIVYVNRAFCRMVGFSEADLIGHVAPQPYWPPEEVEAIDEAIQAARTSGKPHVAIELRLMRRDRERFDVLLYEAPLIDAHGRQTGWMGSVLDITERKRAREHVRQQEEKLAATARLVTMGEMASTIAHELNQPLSAIASYTTGCLNVLEAGAYSPVELKDALQKATAQTQRAGRIIRRVHTFVRKSEPTRKVVGINGVVEEALGFAESDALNRHVRVRTLLSPDDPEVDADPLLLQQVVMNLLRNAMDAMANTPPGAREIMVTTQRAQALVTVSVTDRGCGLSPDVERQLFEPFFSTKPEGMGMGLNICRSILELHRGHVWAERNPAGGTVFSFSLPLEPAT
jgi:two-component system sensor histidine kinase DctS